MSVSIRTARSLRRHSAALLPTLIASFLILGGTASALPSHNTETELRASSFVAMPKVEGLSIKAAGIKLEALNLKNWEVRKKVKNPTTVNQKIVDTQYPKAGASVAEGDIIHLLFSSSANNSFVDDPEVLQPFIVVQFIVILFVIVLLVRCRKRLPRI